MTVDELDARVEKTIEILSDELADEWLDEFEERGFEEERNANEAALKLCFWDAARIIIRELELRAYQERKAREEVTP